MVTVAAERQHVARFVSIAAITALVVLALDYASKSAVIATMDLGEARELVPGWLVLAHVRNTGVAYGLLAGQGWLLVPLSLVATVVVPVVLWRAGLWRDQPVWSGIAGGLILGGALGNLLERLRSGAVTDFIQVPHIPLFQVFNFSDAAICVGAALLLVLSYWRPASE